MNWNPFVVELTQALIKSIVLIVTLLTAFAYLVLMERLVLAKIQSRVGPNRAGPRGLFQPIADAIKTIMKESP